MKIIIELDGRTEQQPEIRRVSGVEQQSAAFDLAAASSSSAIDAGQARVADTSSTSSDSSSQFQASATSSAGGVDAGAARVQDISLASTGMPEDPSGSFSAGAFVSPGHN